MDRSQIVLGLLLVALSALVQLSCKQDTVVGTSPYVRTIDLTVVDTGLTDVFLRVQFLDAALPRSFRVHRDGLPVLTVNNSPADTVVVLDSLMLNRTYRFRTYRLVNTQVTDSSLIVQPKTLDSTSHDFTFQTFRLSTPTTWYSDDLQDVVVVNDTLAYACGAVYVRDSLGQPDPNAYNMMKWNGNTWELKRIWFNATCGQPGQRSYPASSIFAFGPNDIWIATGRSQIAHWNGTIQTATICVPDSFVIKRIWGENPSSIYVVGDGGRISHYINGVWQSLESGTTMPIVDIYGARDDRTNIQEILCVASGTDSPPYGRKVLQIQGMTVSEVPDGGLSQTFRPKAVWHIPGRTYIVGGDFIVNRARKLGATWMSFGPYQNFYTRSIAGTAINDVFVAGIYSGWNLIHFNGSTWYAYPIIPCGWVRRVSTKGNMIIAVGLCSLGPGYSTYAVIGRRE